MTIVFNNFRIVLVFCVLYVLVACTPSEPTSKDSSNIVKTEEKKPSQNIEPQKNPIQQATSIEEKVAAVRTLYKNIEDNLDKFTVKKKPYSGELETILEGELTAYFKNNKIVKLVDSAEEDHGPGQNTFYFINGELFFLFSQITTVEMTEKPTSHVRELRLYFDEGKIIDALIKTQTFKYGETIDMSNIANERDTMLVDSKEEAEYYTSLAEETRDFFKSKETFDEFYGDK